MKLQEALILSYKLGVEALESKGFGINRSKTRYMEYEFILVVVKVLELIE